MNNRENSWFKMYKVSAKNLLEYKLDEELKTYLKHVNPSSIKYSQSSRIPEITINYDINDKIMKRINPNHFFLSEILDNDTNFENEKILIFINKNDRSINIISEKAQNKDSIIQKANEELPENFSM